MWRYYPWIVSTNSTSIEIPHVQLYYKAREEKLMKKEPLWDRSLSCNPSWLPFSTGDCICLGGNMARHGYTLTLVCHSSILFRSKQEHLWEFSAQLKIVIWDFPAGTVVKNLPANAGDTSSIPRLEDPTCHRATKPTRHNYWACALEPASHNYWARMPQLLKPTCPVLRNKRSHRNEKPAHRNEE